MPKVADLAHDVLLAVDMGFGSASRALATPR